MDVQVPFHGRPVGFFRADLIVDASVVVELKAGRALYMEHEQQLLNCLRATTLEVGLLLNFGPRPTFRRLVYSNQRKSRLPD